MEKKESKKAFEPKYPLLTRTYVNSASRAKTSANYLNSSLAKVEAKDLGYDEAILLDINGFVSEGSGENIFYM